MLFLKKRTHPIWDVLEDKILVDELRGHRMNCKEILDAIHYPFNTRTQQNIVVKWLKSKGALRSPRSEYRLVLRDHIDDDVIFSHSCLLF